MLTIIIILLFSSLFDLDYVRDLFKVDYCSSDSPCRQREEATYIAFVDYIDKCEGEVFIACIPMSNTYLFNRRYC